MTWRRPNTIPDGQILCLIVVNNQMCADMFVYNKKEHSFLTNGLVIEFKEVQAWMPASEIQRPDWMDSDMQQREGILIQSVEIAKQYRAERGDLFGTVIDPDDIAEGRV